MADINPFEEVLDPKRQELMAKLHDALGELEMDQGSWAALWLSDLPKLQIFINVVHTSGLNFVASVLSAEEASKMVKIWSARTCEKATNESKMRKRSKSATKLAEERDEKKCVVSHAGEPLEVAHIFPFSLGNRVETKEYREFWRYLSLFWTDQKVEAWKTAVLGPQGTETPANRLTMRCDIHKLWGTARFAFKPLHMNEECTELHVAFYWLPVNEWCERPLIPAPEAPSQVRFSGKGYKLFDNITEKVICSGDTLVFKTNDPIEHPLPAMELLEMQWNLARVQALSGAADVDDDVLWPDFGPSWSWCLELWH
ncbi:hypothetical protein BJX96DRAFT_186 [Aspergillus floccosus]